MDAGLLLQYLVVAIAVVASAGFVLRSQFPHLLRRLRIALALPLLRQSRRPWQQSLGRWIAPAATRVGAGSCGGCDGCGPGR